MTPCWIDTAFTAALFSRDHSHAVRILARAWLDIIWRCWLDLNAYNSDHQNSSTKISSRGLTEAPPIGLLRRNEPWSSSRPTSVGTYDRGYKMSTGPGSTPSSRDRVWAITCPVRPSMTFSSATAATSRPEAAAWRAIPRRAFDQHSGRLTQGGLDEIQLPNDRQHPDLGLVVAQREVRRDRPGTAPGGW